jgi:hypothetical protein
MVSLLIALTIALAILVHPAFLFIGFGITIFVLIEAVADVMTEHAITRSSRTDTRDEEHRGMRLTMGHEDFQRKCLKADAENLSGHTRYDRVKVPVAALPSHFRSLQSV